MAIRLQRRRIVAACFVALAIVCGAIYLSLPWQNAKADFDVLGITLLIVNTPKLMVGLFGALCFVLAVVYWLASLIWD
jgi:hypothetical protein